MELFSQELGVYLLVLLNYPKTYLEKVSPQQVVKGAACHSRIPLLVMPEMNMAIASRRSEGIVIKAPPLFYGGEGKRVSRLLIATRK